MKGCFKMERIIVIDIDNCIANVNKELHERGYRIDVYPSPIPNNVLEDGSIFKEADPIHSVIEKVESIYRKDKDMCLFVSARSGEKHIHKITQEWILTNTSFVFPMLYTKGILKGSVILKVLSNLATRDYDWVVFEDSPHEIMSYLNMKDNLNLNMDFYIPDWKYNNHINLGERIILER